MIRRVRVSDAPALAEIKVQTWRDTYRGLISDKVLDELHLKETPEKWTNILETYPDASDRVCFVEEREKKVVGYCFGVLVKDRQWDLDIIAIYILPPYQGLGIGRTLIVNVVKHFDEIESMVIWVLKDNPAEGFYKKLGGKLSETKTEQIGDMHHTIQGYVYDGKALDELRKLRTIK